MNQACLLLEFSVTCYTASAKINAQTIFNGEINGYFEFGGGIFAGRRGDVPGKRLLLKSDQQKASGTAAKVVVTGDIRNLFDQLWQAHEHLLNEMKQDLDNPDFKFHREFYVLKRIGAGIAGDFIVKSISCLFR